MKRISNFPIYPFSQYVILTISHTNARVHFYDNLNTFTKFVEPVITIFVNSDVYASIVIPFFTVVPLEISQNYNVIIIVV